MDVTAAANFTSGAAAVTLLPNLLDPTVTNRVRPVAAASAGVTAQFGNVASDPVAITATSDEQRLQSIQLEWAAAPAVGPECGLPCKQTFSGLANASEPLALGVTLTDGFTYDAATLLGADAMKGDILDVASLLTFTSDDSQAVSVTQVGDAQLLGNAASAVTISASTECTHSGSPMSSEVQVFANLQPAAMDADVGQLYGPAVRASADATDVPGFPQVRLLRQIPLSESGLHFSPNCLLLIPLFHYDLSYDPLIKFCSFACDMQHSGRGMEDVELTICATIEIFWTSAGWQSILLASVSQRKRRVCHTGRH